MPLLGFIAAPGLLSGLGGAGALAPLAGGAGASGALSGLPLAAAGGAAALGSLLLLPPSVLEPLEPANTPIGEFLGGELDRLYGFTPKQGRPKPAGGGGLSTDPVVVSPGGVEVNFTVTYTMTEVAQDAFFCSGGLYAAGGTTTTTNTISATGTAWRITGATGSSTITCGFTPNTVLTPITVAEVRRADGSWQLLLGDANISSVFPVYSASSTRSYGGWSSNFGGLVQTPEAPVVPTPVQPGTVPETAPLPEVPPDREKPLAPPLAPPVTVPLPQRVPDPQPVPPPAPAPGGLPGRAPAPGPSPLTAPGRTPAPASRPPLPQAAPVTAGGAQPLLPPAPATTGTGTTFLPGGRPLTDNGPRPTPEGIATELGKLEQKLEILLNPKEELSPLDLLNRIIDQTENIKFLLETLFPPGPYTFDPGQYELAPVCDRDSEGALLPPRVAPWPGGEGEFVELRQRLDALAVLIQHHKDMKQPTCGGRTNVPHGNVTVHFESD